MKEISNRIWRPTYEIGGDNGEESFVDLSSDLIYHHLVYILYIKMFYTDLVFLPLGVTHHP